MRHSALAAAIDRVLEAERCAAAAIETAERDAENSLEHARAERRALLGRTHARIRAVHARVAQAIEELDRETETRIAALESGRHEEVRLDCIDQAIAQLADRLIGATEADDGHGA